MGKEIRFEIPEGTVRKICQGCGGDMYWVKTKNEKWMPVNPDGTPHWSTCPKGKHYRAPRTPRRRGL